MPKEWYKKPHEQKDKLDRDSRIKKYDGTPGLRGRTTRSRRQALKAFRKAQRPEVDEEFWRKQL